MLSFSIILNKKSGLTSVWLPTYFVSAPRERVFWLRGGANMSSMQTMAPLSWHNSNTDSRSSHFRNKFFGDSAKKSLTSKEHKSICVTCWVQNRQGNCHLSRWIFYVCVVKTGILYGCLGLCKGCSWLLQSYCIKEVLRIRMQNTKTNNTGFLRRVWGCCQQHI